MALLIGALSAVLTRLLGSGGALLTVTLLLVSGAEPRVAVGTAVAYTLVMGGRGTWRHLRRSPTTPADGEARLAELDRPLGWRGPVASARAIAERARKDPRGVVREPGFAAGVGAVAGVVLAELMGGTLLAVGLAACALGLAWLELWPTKAEGASTSDAPGRPETVAARPPVQVFDQAAIDLEDHLVGSAPRGEGALAARSGVSSRAAAATVSASAPLTARATASNGGPAAPAHGAATNGSPTNGSPTSGPGGNGASDGNGKSHGNAAPPIGPSPVLPAPSPGGLLGWFAGRGAGGLAVVAASLGILRGAAGVGGAAVVLPWAGRTLGLSRRAVAEGLLWAVLAGSIAASLTHAVAGNIDWLRLVLLLAGGGLGSLASGCILRPVSDSLRSRVLAGVLATCAVLLLLGALT